jgi:hypothetical protein
MDDYEVLRTFMIVMLWFIAIGITICAEEAHIISKREKHEREES